MKYIIKLCFVALPLLMYGCGAFEWGTPKLYTQKIEGTSKILYNYDIWGGRDTEAAGFTILELKDTFNVYVAEDTKLPLHYLQDTPNKGNINGVTFKIPDGQLTDNNNPIFIPISVNKEIFDGIKVSVKKYQYSGFADRDGGLKEYEFKSFKETRDSLFFYDLDDNESMEHEHLDSIKFKKTNVYISQIRDGQITKIEITDLILSKINSEILSNIRYVLKPKPEIRININDFSDYGVFKEKLIPKVTKHTQ